MKRLMLLFLTCVLVLSSFSLCFAEAAVEEENHVVTIERTQDELDAIHEKNLENALRKMQCKDQVMSKGSKAGFDDGEYRTVWSSPKRTKLSGFCGNQPPEGTRFQSSGGFYISKTGGPSCSTSVKFSAPFKGATITIDLGKVKSGGGVYVNAPDTKHYFKAKCTKEFEVKSYIVYRKPSPNEAEYVYTRGTSEALKKEDYVAVRV